MDLVEDLIQRGIPGGYYDMGSYLMQGYGVVGDFDLGKRYYRSRSRVAVLSWPLQQPPT